MGELYYKDLSYEVVGLAFEVFNNLGYGYREKLYHRGYEEELINKKLGYKREVPIVLRYKDKIIGKYFIDFVVENKIVIEFKVANDFYTRDIKQLISYLKATGMKLGILIIFTKDGVKYRRFVN